MIEINVEQLLEIKVEVIEPSDCVSSIPFNVNESHTETDQLTEVKEEVKYEIKLNQSDKKTNPILPSISEKSKQNFFECEKCFKRFRKKNNLINHCLVHLGTKKKYACSICGRKFDTISSRAVHRTEKHPVSFLCDACGKTFKRKCNLKHHEISHAVKKSKEPKVYKCDVCTKIFTRNSHLIAHQRIHTGEKPFQCQDCYKSFSQNSTLVQHKRIHVADKLFECNECSKSFSRNWHLVEHQRIHTGLKPFQCQNCNKSFTHRSTLVQHQRIHSGEKLFQCKVCTKSFNQKSHLMAHGRIHTGLSQKSVEKFKKKLKSTLDVTKVLNLDCPR